MKLYSYLSGGIVDRRVMRYVKTNRLSCFSPPVMVATFAIELFLAMYVVWRYKLNDVTRIAMAILTFLAVFQLAEYNVCEGSFGVDSLDWSRIGYIAITALPPLGFHLATKLSGQKRRATVALGYVTGGLFALFFAFSGHGLTASACLGNYVIFQTAPGSTLYYSIYYYGWLLFGAMYAFSQAKEVAAHRARALRALGMGYLAFIVPTTLVNVVSPSTLAGIPSIMCGFAVILAIVLAGEALPQYFRQPALSSFIIGKKQGTHGKVSR